MFASVRSVSRVPRVRACSACSRFTLCSLNKSSRALDIRVFTLRNRIEDQEVALKWKDTLSLAADIGTKLFSIKRFKFLRDLVNGYALARANGKLALPSMVIKLR